MLVWSYRHRLNACRSAGRTVLTSSPEVQFPFISDGRVRSFFRHMPAFAIRRRCVAVLGTGSAGMRHLAALQRIEGVLPVAIPVRSGRRPTLEKLGYVTAANLSEAAHTWGAESCIVATDTGRHLEDSLLALSSSLHLLVEKPMCADAVQARKLWLQAQEARRKLFVGCVLRFSQSLDTLRMMLSELGKPHAIRIECQSYLPNWRPDRAYKDSYSSRSLDGGVLRDLIHEIDYAGWLFGWPETVRARLTNQGQLGIDSEEAADLEWETPQGAVLSMRLDYITKPSRRRMVVYGERGTVEWDAIQNVVRLSVEGKPGKEVVSDQTHDGLFQAQAQAFLDVVAGVPDERLASGLDGGHALAVCDAARHASECRSEEKVAYP